MPREGGGVEGVCGERPPAEIRGGLSSSLPEVKCHLHYSLWRMEGYGTKATPLVQAPGKKLEGVVRKEEGGEDKCPRPPSHPPGLSFLTGQ